MLITGIAEILTHYCNVIETCPLMEIGCPFENRHCTTIKANDWLGVLAKLEQPEIQEAHTCKDCIHLEPDSKDRDSGTCKVHHRQLKPTYSYSCNIWED